MDDVVFAVMESRRLPRSEMQTIIDRVGRTPVERLAWALRFAQTRTDGLTGPDRENSRLEVSTFLRFEHFPNYEMQEGEQLADFQQLHLLDWMHVQRIQREFRAVLTQFENRGMAELGPFTATYVLPLPEITRMQLIGPRRPAASTPLAPVGRERELDGDTIRIIRHRGSVEFRSLASPALILAVRKYQDELHRTRRSLDSTPRRALNLFAQHLERHLLLLRKCPASDCGVWFIAERSNQEYCIRAHKSREATRAKRARDAARLAVKPGALSGQDRAHKARRKRGHS